MKHVMRRATICLVLSLILVLFSGAVYAKDLTISMAFLPGILETPDKGPFVDLVQAMDNAYSGSIARGVYPFPRSIENVLSGKADFHLPMIRNKLVSESSLPYAYSSDKLGDVCFVIYSHKDNPITVDKIKQAKSSASFPLKLETSGGFDGYFDFPINTAMSVESALKKVNLKRIDGFIFAQEECDHVTKQEKLSNIHRELYDRFDDVFIIQKGSAGKEVDSILSTILAKMKADGTLADLHKRVHLDFQQWQP
jgi:polar amino acid transport system substrate-binding protein